MSLNPEKARTLLEAYKSVSGPESMDALDDVFSFLLPQLELLRSQANGYPRRGISADVWFSGKALAKISDSFADELESRGNLTEPLELATHIAAAMALQVVGHYPNEIFPRVLRNGKCREALGESQRAAEAYSAIVSDFHKLGLDAALEEFLDESVPPDANIELVALAAAQEACTRLSALQPERAGELTLLAERIGLGLAKARIPTQAD